MTQSKEGPFFIRSKIWFEDDSGEVIFGLGRLKMLEAIERQGSIQAAAKELKMSYRALWGRITATENRMGRQLLTRNIGGASGGGSQLTPFAKKFDGKFPGRSPAHRPGIGSAVSAGNPF